MRKYGIDPHGSEVHKLESKEAFSKLKSITYNPVGEDDDREQQEEPQLYEGKDWRVDQEESSNE